MATTTNYGWTTPDDTALVKDGAAAIRTLGSSVDTTTKALNPSTTLGDIEFRSSTSNTNTRLGIGSTGNVLTVAAGVPSWAAPAGGLTLLSTTTLSGATTTISSIPTTYTSLKMIIVGARINTSLENFVLRINGDSGANYTVGRFHCESTTGGFFANINETGIYLSYVIGFDTGVQKLLHGNFDITNYASASGGILISGGSQCFANSQSRSTINSVYDNAAACTSLTFSTSGGRTFQSGTVYLYGVK